MLCPHGASMRALVFVASTLPLLVAGVAARADSIVYEITLKGQTFIPAELKVPAGTAFIIRMRNENDAPAEFESTDMKFEKIVAGHSEIITRVKPLPGGEFEFYDEYHQDVARGTVVSE